MTDDGIYDVIIVGSGAAGAMAAYELCEAGLSVLMVEAGRDYDPQTETPMFHTPEAAPLRAAGTPDKEIGYYNATINGGWQIPGEPYAVMPGSDAFQWWRPRMLGGRTNHWGRVALRYGPYDFKPYSRDGLGVDWPISYEELAPSYDRVERLIGVTGTPHALENTPDSPPGVLLPPPSPRAHEIFLSAAFRHFGMPVAAIHAAVLTRPHGGRAECVYATQCTRGCSSRSNFQSTTVLIPPAVATGKLTILCDAPVHRVDIDSAGKAEGVTFLDRATGEEFAVKGRSVILAAGAFSSVRILLNSRSGQFPDGIGNAHGLVGKYIMDSVEFSMKSQIPALEEVPPQNDDGIFTPHIYVPWWLYGEQATGKLDFPRGYHIEPRGGRRMPTIGLGSYVDKDDPLYGEGLREHIRRRYGSYLFLTGEGEMIPNDDTYCELDLDTVDKWGIPTLRFHWKWSEHELRQQNHMFDTFNAIFVALGGAPEPGPPAPPPGGSAIHEVGGARMGASESTSVLDAFGRCWAVPNLFVFDGAAFASSADKNPTLTILALASRGARQLAEAARRGEL